MSPGINRGIVDGFTRGLLTSTSVAACGGAAADGLRLLEAHPALDVGVHLVLCDERPLLPRSDLSSVPFRDGRLASLRVLAAALAAGRVRIGEVEAEWRAQIERVLQAGLSPSHLDSHRFVHLLPGLYPLCLRLAEEYRVRHVRRRVTDRLFPGPGPIRVFQYLALKAWVSSYARRPARHDLPPGVVTAGVLHAGGRWSVDGVLSVVDRFLRRRGDAVLEVMLHPGYADAGTAEKYRAWGYRWESDLELLTDPALARGLEARNVQVSSFRDLG